MNIEERLPNYAGKLMVNNINKAGPRTEPWGTPRFTGSDRNFTVLVLPFSVLCTSTNFVHVFR